MSQRAATAAKPLTRKPDADELAMSIAEWLASAIESGATPAQILQPFTTAIGAAVATYADSSAKPGHEGRRHNRHLQSHPAPRSSRPPGGTNSNGALKAMNARLTLAAIMIAAAVAAAMAILTGARLTSGRPPHFVGTEKPVTVGSMEIAEHCAPDSETVLEQPE